MTWLYRLSRISPSIVYSRCGILLKEVHCLHIGQWWKEDNAYIAPLAFSGRSSGIFSHANPVNWFERELWKLVYKFINKTNFGQCVQDLIRFCRSWVGIATYQCYQHDLFAISMFSWYDEKTRIHSCDYSFKGSFPSAFDLLSQKTCLWTFSAPTRTRQK